MEGPENAKEKGVDKAALERFPPAMLGALVYEIKLLMCFHSLRCVGKSVLEDLFATGTIRD